jgi:hypothetical protein
MGQAVTFAGFVKVEVAVVGHGWRFLGLIKMPVNPTRRLRAFHLGDDVG